MIDIHNDFARPLAATLVASATLTAAAVADCQPALTIKLTSPSAGVEDEFGLDVALAGDTLFVGAPLEDTAGEDVGAVHVYGRTGGTWAHEAALFPADPVPFKLFGSSIAVDRDQPETLMVGAPYDDEVTGDAGAVYVFTRTEEGTWIQDAKLTSLDTADETCLFGWDVAFDGDTALIGAPYQGGFFGGASGKVYVFERSNGVWAQIQRLDELTVPAGGFFGSAIELEGDRAVVGAQYIGMQYIQGQAFVYSRVAGLWELEQELAGAISVARDRFGSGIALMGDFAVIGSPRDGPPPHGLFSTFERQADAPEGGGPWVTLGYVIPDDSTLVDRFGTRIASDGQRLAVGAMNHDERGAVYLYDFDRGDTTLRFELSAADGEQWDSFGTGLALSGGTLAVGATWDDDAAENAGAVYVYELARADLDGDLDVDFGDLLALLALWGPCPAPPADCPADFNNSGGVDFADLLTLLSEWGPCP